MNKNSFHIYALITIFFWSLAFVFTRLTLQFFSAFSLGFLRYFIASCSLLVVALLIKMQKPHLKDCLYFLAAGFFGFFAYMIAFNIGQASVTASTASIVIATVPVITAVFARIIYREKLWTHQWIAVFIEFTGVIVLTMMNGMFSSNSGLLWLLLAAICLSIYNLLQRKLTKSYTALQTSTYSIFFGTFLLAIFAPTSLSELSKAPAVQYMYLIILGVFCSAIAYVAWAKAFSKAKNTSQVSNYMFLTPFITSILGFLIVKEVPDCATLIGGGIILIGVFVFNFGEKLFQKN